jgi:hypothetical protein
VIAVALVAAGLGGMRYAASQAPFRDGAFVVGQDGSRWIVSGGTKYRITFTTDDTNALAGLPEGPSVAVISDVPAGAVSSSPGNPPAPVVGGPTADYQFQNALGSAVGGAPDLITLGGTNFASERIDGAPHTVLTFPEGGGLQLTPVTGVLSSDSYTIVILARLDTVSGYRRLVDFKNGTTDPGLYTYSGDLVMYGVDGANGSGAPIQANRYAQVVLTRDRNGTVTGYVDGVRQFQAQDTSGAGIVSSAGVLRFFRDDGSEHSGGAVARIRLYDRVLGADEVAALDRLP